MTEFVLITHDGHDTLHIEHPWEQCNTDDALVVAHISEDTAAEFLASGQARACEFCEPVPDPQILNTRGKG